MARITSEQLQLLQDFLDTLSTEARSKCSLCNSTLTHIVKRAEAEIGVGTATVARALAEKVNETALPADRVTEGQLRDRVRRSAGEKESGRFAQIKKVTPDAIMDAYVCEGNPQKLGHGDPTRASQAFDIVGFAIVQLERLTKSDPKWPEAIRKVKAWLAEFEGGAA